MILISFINWILTKYNRMQQTTKKDLCQKITKQLNKSLQKKLIEINIGQLFSDSQYSSQATSSTDNNQFSNVCRVSRNQQVCIYKKDLAEFIRKFAQEKVQLEQTIYLLKANIQQQKKSLMVYSQNNEQLTQNCKKLQMYMLELTEKHEKQILQIKQSSLNLQNYKDKQIKVLNNKLFQLQNSIKYEKQHNQRYVEFLKIKQDIIKNLEWQLSIQKNKSISKSKCTSVIDSRNKALNDSITIDNRSSSGSKTKELKNQIMRSGRNDRQSSAEWSSSKSIRLRYQDSHNKNKLLQTQKITIAKTRTPQETDKQTIIQLKKENRQLKANIQVLQVDLELLSKQLKNRNENYTDQPKKLIFQQAKRMNISFNQYSKQRSASKQNKKLVVNNVVNSKVNQKMNQQLVLLREKCFLLEIQLQTKTNQAILVQQQLANYKILKLKLRQLMPKKEDQRQVKNQKISQFDCNQFQMTNQHYRQIKKSKIHSESMTF